MRRFYQATSQQQVEETAEGDLRVSLDGHPVPRYTRLVELPKTRLSSSGRVEKADEVLSAFDLDRDTFLALRIRRGGKNLHRVVPSLVRELLAHRQGRPGYLRLFIDRGAYKGALFQELKANPQVHFPGLSVQDRLLPGGALPNAGGPMGGPPRWGLRGGALRLPAASEAARK